MTDRVFSALPYHVVRQVANYVCQPKTELDMGLINDEPVNPLVALLHICHDWRQVTLPIMFGTGYIGISDIHKPNTVSTSYQKRILKCINKSYNAYMAKLTIRLQINKTICGDSLSILTASKVGSFVFPNVKHVIIIINYAQQTPVQCSNANSNIRQLVQHIFQMLPALNSIELAYLDAHKGIRICMDTLHVNNLADELSETMSVIYYIHSKSLGSGTKCSLIPAGLTSLSISSIADNNIIYNLIYANSQSLQKLYISLCESQGVEELVHRHGSEEEYMYYPRLTELKLSGWGLMSENIVPPTGNAVVFPRLCKVDIGFEYPFSDDVLFRGNRWTLESIELALSTQAMMQLSLDGVFNKGNMLALQNVVIRSHEETTNNAMLNNCSKNFFQGLLSSCQYLALQAQSYYDILIGSIDSKTPHYNLKYLHLGCSNVSFESIVVLLQALPRLSYFKSTISSLGDKYSGMSFSKMLKYMKLTSNKLSQSFNTWSIDNLESESVDLITTCILLLIDQCPNFQTTVFNNVMYTIPIKIYEKLLFINARVSRLYANRNEKLQFNISFAPSNVTLHINRNFS